MKNRIEGLDLLRFAAAFSVLLYHYFFIGPLQGYWPQSQFFSITHFGDFGVDVFFIISGFVISVSAEGRTFIHFIKSRFLRILPALFVCSIITAITSSLLPGVSVREIFIRWLSSLTLFPEVFGVDLLSGVYWTLQIEVKFYIIVALLILLKIWAKHKYTILPLWLIISLINAFYLNNKLLSDYLLTEYAGHFIVGILLFQVRKKEQNSFTILGFVLSGVLMWKHLVNFEGWISGAYEQAFTDIGTFLIVPVMIAIVYWVSGCQEVPIPSKIVAVLGSMSYTLYLLHADLGFFIRAFTDRWIFAKYSGAPEFFTDPVVVTIAFTVSLLISAIVAMFIEPRVRRLLQQIINNGLFIRKRENKKIAG